LKRWTFVAELQMIGIQTSLINLNFLFQNIQE